MAFREAHLLNLFVVWMMVVETKVTHPFVPVSSYKKSRNKLRLSWAKLKLSYEEVLSLSCSKSWKGSHSSSKSSTTSPLGIGHRVGYRVKQI